VLSNDDALLIDGEFIIALSKLFVDLIPATKPLLTVVSPGPVGTKILV
jgi:hypothetical protein